MHYDLLEMGMQTEVEEVCYHIKVSGNCQFYPFHLGYVDFVLQISLDFMGCYGDKKFIFSKIYFSKTIRGRKLKLYTYVNQFILYIGMF